MSFTADDAIQQNSGTSASGAFSVTLSSGTTAGNTIIVVTFSGSSLPVTPPAGWSQAAMVNATPGRVYVFYLSDVAAAQTSFGSFTPTSGAALWWVREHANVDFNDPVDVTVSNTGSPSNGGTLSSGTSAQCAGLSTYGVAIFADGQASGVTNTWSGYTNNFVEAAEVNIAASFQMAVAEAYLDGVTGTWSTTATLASSGVNPVPSVGVIVTFRAADAPVAFPLAHISSFKWATHGGMGNLAPNNPHGGGQATTTALGTGIQILSGSARDGGYGLCTNTSAAAVSVPVASGASFPSAAVGFNVGVESGSGVVLVDRITNSSTHNVELVYDVSNTKFGLRWDAGTVSYQSGTTALAASASSWVDIRLKTNSSTYHAEWWLEGVAQTSPADLTGQSPTGVTTGVQVASGATQTMKAHHSDFVWSRYYAAGPLGRHWLKLLKVDPSGTPSVSGTSANFNVFTANGTLAAWNAANARDALDEVPPTVSASADGVVQNAVAASDYMEFPMETYTCTSDEVIAAARMVAPAWGGTGTGTGTLGIRGYDGTAETTLITTGTSYDAGSPTAVDATNPLWIQGMWLNTWTQPKLDNAALRVGFSTDATPDMGVSALYLEVAVRKATTARQVTLEDPMSATADIRMNPYSSASVSYLVTNNDATRSVNFNYTGTGTPTSPVTVGPSSSQEVVVTANNFGDIPDVSLEAI